MMGGGPMAGMTAMFSQMGNKQTEKGAKSTGNMLKSLQNIDPIQKLMNVWDQGINAALPMKDIAEAQGEAFSIWGDAVSEGFAPAMEPIIETLTKPEVLEALTEIGKAFADMMIAMQPLIEYLLPAMIWMLKAIGNIIILVVNIVITIINFFSFIIDAIMKAFGVKDTGLHPIPYYNYIAAGGLDIMTEGPTSILAGEAGPEHVQITPAGEEASSGKNITVIVNAGTIIAERDLIDLIRKNVDDVVRENTLLK